MIKQIPLFIAGLALMHAGASMAQNTTADGKAAVAGYDSYGKVISPEQAMSAAAFTQLMGGRETADVKLQAEVLTSCQKKGCWMDVKLADGSTMKVRFVDYAFFVPTSGMEGRTAVLQGTASKEVITEAMRRHYAHDAGKSAEECEAIKGDQAELTFLAEGVLIKQ